MSTINSLKSALGAGARASKYKVQFSFPSAVNVSSDARNIDLLCKSSTFPGVDIGVIEVWNQGRKLPLPGDTSFSNEWTLSFYNTENHDIRRSMLAWLVACDHFQTNTHTGVPAELMIDAVITQLDSAGKDVVSYTFHNIFVKGVGEISVADDSVDAIQEFDVTLSFSDWVVGTDAVNVPTGNYTSTGNITSLDSINES